MPEVLGLRSRRIEHAEISANVPATHAATAPTTVFDRCWRQYALCREYLFTDHTQHIVSAIKPMLDGSGPRFLVEAGCGPGFYSRRLAARFPQLHITGIDLSEPLLSRAQARAHRSGLHNCHFLKADALSLAESPGQVDAVIASRLFLILAQPVLALDAIFTALRPGGLCFIAEPTSLLSAAVPLLFMKMTERLGRSAVVAGQLPQSRIFSGNDFESLVESQPWRSIRIWKDRQYHCAVCKKTA